MTAPIVRAPSPPDQDVTPVIHSWGDPLDCLQIEAAGPELALIVRVVDDERTEYGTITWDAEAQTHLPRWNQAGLLAYPMRKRDAIDDEIYDGMDRWISKAWLRHQDAETRRMLTRRGAEG
jgi:hypothetical protein